MGHERQSPGQKSWILQPSLHITLYTYADSWFLILRCCFDELLFLWYPTNREWGQPDNHTWVWCWGSSKPLQWPFAISPLSATLQVDSPSRALDPTLMGTAEQVRILLVVCLTSTSGMSILQTAITSYLQKNCYKRVVHFNVSCLFSPPPHHSLRRVRTDGEPRARSAPINKAEVGSGLFHPSLGWSCVCGAGGGAESSVFPAAVPLWELHAAIKHLVAAR